MAKGMVASLTMVQREVISATSTPPPQPMMKPPKASQKVAPVDSKRIERSAGLSQRSTCAMNSAKIAEGLGRRNCWILKARTMSSQRAMTATAIAMVGR